MRSPGWTEKGLNPHCTQESGADGQGNLQKKVSSGNLYLHFGLLCKGDLSPIHNTQALESSASESDTGNPHFDLIPRGAEQLRQKDSSAGCRLLQHSRVIRNG